MRTQHTSLWAGQSYREQGPLHQQRWWRLLLAKGVACNHTAPLSLHLQRSQASAHEHNTATLEHASLHEVARHIVTLDALCSRTQSRPLSMDLCALLLLLLVQGAGLTLTNSTMLSKRFSPTL